MNLSLHGVAGINQVFSTSAPATGDKADTARLSDGNSEFLLGQQLSNRTTLVGIAFETADLVLLQAWAGLHEMRMVVELDQCVDNHEYEEIVALYVKSSGLRRWNLWRPWDGVVVQPIIGRSKRFGSVTAAMKALSSIGP